MTKGLTADVLDDLLDPAMGELPEGFEPTFSDFLPKGYLSISQATLVLKCPRAYELKYVEGKPARTSHRLFEGRNVHKAAEIDLKAKMKTGRLPGLDLALDAFDTAFEETRPHIEDWEGQDPGKAKDLGVLLTTRFHENAAPEAAPIDVEARFAVQIDIPGTDGKKKLPLVGVVDSMQVQLDRPALEYDPEEVRKSKLPRRLHDLKVVTDKWGENDLPNDLQFHTYAGVHGVPDVQVDQLVKGRAKEPRPRYEKANYVVTSRDVAHAFRVLGGAAKVISLGHFPMTDPSNWWCGEKWCSMWSHCRGKK